MRHHLKDLFSRGGRLCTKLRSRKVRIGHCSSASAFSVSFKGMVGNGLFIKCFPWLQEGSVQSFFFSNKRQNSTMGGVCQAFTKHFLSYL